MSTEYSENKYFYYPGETFRMFAGHRIWVNRSGYFFDGWDSPNVYITFVYDNASRTVLGLSAVAFSIALSMF